MYKKAQDARKTIEETLRQLDPTSTDLEAVRDVGRQVLDACAMRKTIPDKLAQLESMQSVKEIVAFCYNTYMSGEGLAVIK